MSTWAPGRQCCRPGAALVLTTALALLTACGDDPVSSVPGPGSAARPSSECPTRFDDSFELVGRFPVEEPRSAFAITGDRVAFVEPDGTAHDVRLVGLAGSSDPDLDQLLLDDVRSVGRAGSPHPPVHVVPAVDGLVTAHGTRKAAVVTRFDRAGFPVWRTRVPTAGSPGELSDLQVVDDHVYVRYLDLSAYPGTHAALELDYASGDVGTLEQAGDDFVLEERLDLQVDHPAYAGFGEPGGPAAAVPAEAPHLGLDDSVEPGETEGAVMCGEVLYWISGLELWVVPDGPPFDPDTLGDPVSVARAVPDLQRRVDSGDGAIMGVTPDAVWVGWSDPDTGEGEMFALRYGT